MSLEADPQNGLFYGVETLARKVAAFKLTASGIKTVWKKTQTTTEWATLIGPKDHRVWVGTDIPGAEIPGENTTATVVFRDAATGRELARSARVPRDDPGKRGSARLRRKHVLPRRHRHLDQDDAASGAVNAMPSAVNRALTAPSCTHAWKTIPSWYVPGTINEAIRPAIQLPTPPRGPG